MGNSGKLEVNSFSFKELGISIFKCIGVGILALLVGSAGIVFFLSAFTVIVALIFAVILGIWVIRLSLAVVFAYLLTPLLIMAVGYLGFTLPYSLTLLITGAACIFGTLISPIRVDPSKYKKVEENK